MPEKISILGSTGSIGTQSLDIINKLEKKIVALCANSNTKLLAEQALAFCPDIIAIGDKEKYSELKSLLPASKIKILCGTEGVCECAEAESADTVISASVGNAGILPAFNAIEAKKNLALANKETIVSAGELIIPLANANRVKILPIDSEHSAILQCLEGNRGNKVKRILLTASGGPFRNTPAEELLNVTAADALRHPTWSMGPKITIDSATMMNKGLELIEAHRFFDVPPEKIEILVHPQSIVHSAVEFEDSAIIAQMGLPDMRVPIAYALSYPKRFSLRLESLDLTSLSGLTFEKPDFKKFGCLKLAKDVLKTGGAAPAVLNAANEAAVYRFLNGEIGFLDIPSIIESALSAYTFKRELTLEDIFEADSWAREYVLGYNKR
ncbi:MAG: 1-deoxy-D-xylulose-5-phosphate reductoisomerase [Firmicutes bacterium]|nr:1-deoxy-D-xylulose-5-phosphate reductoisomerase [Bacillota bacterium]